jgi:HEPN domain
MQTFSNIRGGLIKEFFVRTADENYITARWCAVNELNLDFFWLASHCLEKYLKAVLLFNGQSSTKQGHDIGLLFSEVRKLGGPLLPSLLTKPPRLTAGDWQDVSPETFLKDIYQNGNPDNRYLIYGFAKHGHQLVKLDQVVFAIRRLICSLDDNSGRTCDTTGESLTNRQRLLAEPTYYTDFDKPLDHEVKSGVASPKQFAALNLNASFAPTGFEHSEVSQPLTYRSSAINWGLLSQLKSANSSAALEAVRAAEWLLANVQLPSEKSSDLKKDIEKEIDAAKKRHHLP